jgi:hypothetical protein
VSIEATRRWRDYRTASGRRPIKEFSDEPADGDAAAVAAAMTDVREVGLTAARHLRGEIHEVRADGDRQTFRILFAREGRRGRVLLPPQKIRLAERRLAEWRRRSNAQSRR